MSKAELQKRLLGKYPLLVLPERPGKPSTVTIIDQDAKTTVGNVYFENNRVVSVSRKAYDSNKSDAVRLADLLRVAFTEMLAGKQIDVVAVSLSTHRDPKGYSVDYLSFGFGNRKYI